MNLMLLNPPRNDDPHEESWVGAERGFLGEGFAISLGEALDWQSRHRVFPARLSERVDAEAIALLQAWLDRAGSSWSEGLRPWIPIGRVGPLPVLGHWQPGTEHPPLPWGTFQPVLLRRSDYEQLCLSIGAVWRRTQAEEWTGGVGRFPSTLVVPTERPSALQFLRQYYLHRPEDILAFEDALDREGSTAKVLPPGYELAANFLAGGDAVMPLAPVLLSDEDQLQIPPGLRRRITVIFSANRVLWVCGASGSSADLEDRLYSELGEGWNVHWIKACIPERESGPEVPGMSDRASGQPKKLVRGGMTARSVRGGVVEAEERQIAIDEREWARFDPRSKAVDPGSLWKWCIFDSLRFNATDLHIEPGVSVARVRRRIDGLLEEVLEVPVDIGESMVFSLMNQAGLGSDKYRPVDGSFTLKWVEAEDRRTTTIRVRANAYPVRGRTQKLALRFLPVQGKVPALESILTETAAGYVKRAIARADGLILVCGPTGSGKTTTIFSCLQRLNRPEWNITTLENPVEYELEGANQGEINESREVSWGELNKAFLRQDPDIGLIGEIRDEDTMRTVLRTALTGHLVFGSLHTKSCPTALTRMADLGANRQILAETLVLVLSQRLIRRLCPRCAREVPISAEQQAAFESHGRGIPGFLRTSLPQGCAVCRGRGYVGRVAAVELMPNAVAVRRMIEDGAPGEAYASWMHEHGFPTVYEDALDLAARGVTSFEEAGGLQDAWEGEKWSVFGQ